MKNQEKSPEIIEYGLLDREKPRTDKLVIATKSKKTFHIPIFDMDMTIYDFLILIDNGIGKK